MSVRGSNMSGPHKEAGSARRRKGGTWSARLGLLLVVALFASACGGSGSGTAAEVEISGLGASESAETTERDAPPVDDTTATAANEGTAAEETVATEESATTGDPEPANAPEPTSDASASPAPTTRSGVSVGELIPVSAEDGSTTTTVQGSIDVLGEVDFYTLDVSDGESFAIEQLGGCVFEGDDQLRVRVIGAGINTSNWMEKQDIDDDCLDINRYNADEDGTVLLEVGHSQDDITGSYAFRVINVSDDPLVMVAIGETVQGNLEFTGSNDVFGIPVAADQAILIRQLGGCDYSGGDQLRMSVRGPGVNTSVFLDEYDVQERSDCADYSRFVADDSGTLILRVEDTRNMTTGTYGFEVTDVTGQPAVTVAFGDVISPDSPTEGAGTIEQPGVENKYLLPVREGQSFVIKQLGGCAFSGTESITFSVRGPGINTSVYFDELDLEENTNCDESDRFDVDEDGTVVITSGHNRNEATGSYSFEIVDVTDAPPVKLEFGDVVGPDGGIEGTGVLEVAGEQDVYWFEVEAGQTFAIEGLGNCNFSGDDTVNLAVRGPGTNTTLYLEELDLEEAEDCLIVERFVVEESGRMVLTVLNSGHDVTGTYNFTVTAGAETADDAQVVLDELGAEETEQGTLITIDETLLFAFGSWELKGGSASELSKVADVLGVFATGTVQIIGHTDSVGDEDDNQRLSERRATAVANALTDLGVDSERLDTSGAGETQPVADNENADGSDNEEGRAANRRVEILFDPAG